MASIGRRDKLVTLERADTAQDSTGDQLETWSTIGQEWAAIYYGRGSERRQAAMEEGEQPANFGMLANPITLGLKVKDRISYDDAIWDIEGVAPDTPRRGEVEITAIRSA